LRQAIKTTKKKQSAIPPNVAAIIHSAFIKSFDGGIACVGLEEGVEERVKDVSVGIGVIVTLVSVMVENSMVVGNSGVIENTSVTAPFPTKGEVIEVLVVLIAVSLKEKVSELVDCELTKTGELLTRNNKEVPIKFFLACEERFNFI
jgi:hypothetical protein